MCYAPLKPARPSGMIRAVEVFGGVIALVVVAVALWSLRDRFVPPPAGVVPPIASVTAPAQVQLALGGSATPLPSPAPAQPTPTRPAEATSTAPPPPPSPTLEPTITLTPRPQTGGRETSGPREYIIQAGDTLLGIAVKFNVSLDDLVRANNLGGANALILPGKALNIPQSGQAANTDNNAAGQTGSKSEEPPATEPTERITYTVQNGDVLGSIASRFNKTAEDLARLNNFRSVNDMLQIGQVLVIEVNVTATPRPPTATPAPPTATPPPPTATAAPPTATTPAQVDVAPTPGPTASSAPTVASAPTADNQAKALTAPNASASGTGDTDTTTNGAAYRYPAPSLLGVPNKMKVAGKTAPLLNWTSVGVLGPDEFYVVKVSAVLNGKPVTDEGWTKATGWRLSDKLKPGDKATEPTTYIWEVVVKRATARGSDGQPTEGTAISPASATYEFTWAQ